MTQNKKHPVPKPFKSTKYIGLLNLKKWEYNFFSYCIKITEWKFLGISKATQNEKPWKLKNIS